jgi:hypothetical protein
MPKCDKRRFARDELDATSARRPDDQLGTASQHAEWPALARDTISRSKKRLTIGWSRLLHTALRSARFSPRHRGTAPGPRAWSQDVRRHVVCSENLRHDSSSSASRRWPSLG